MSERGEIQNIGYRAGEWVLWTLVPRKIAFSGSEADELGMGSLVQVQMDAVLDRCRCSWWCLGDGWNGAAAE